jgi:hypothetical protein
MVFDAFFFSQAMVSGRCSSLLSEQSDPKLPRNKNVTKAHHRFDRFVLCHPTSKGLPILGVFLQMVNWFRDIRQRAVDVEDDNLLFHRCGSYALYSNFFFTPFSFAKSVHSCPRLISQFR